MTSFQEQMNIHTTGVCISPSALDSSSSSLSPSCPFGWWEGWTSQGFLRCLGVVEFSSTKRGGGRGGDTQREGLGSSQVGVIGENLSVLVLDTPQTSPSLPSSLFQGQGINLCYNLPLNTSRVVCHSGSLIGPWAFVFSLSHSTQRPLPDYFAEIQLCSCLSSVLQSRGGLWGHTAWGQM